MAIIQREENIYLIRIYQGRDPITKKRLEVNETFKGTYQAAQKREIKLKDKNYSGNLIKNSRITVNELLDLYLDSTRHKLEATTQHKYRTYLGSYVRPFLGDVPITKITTSVIQNLFNHLLDKNGASDLNDNDSERRVKGLAVGTVRVMRNPLKLAFDYALESRLLAENPVSKAHLPAVEESPAKSFTIEEGVAFTSVKDHFWYGNAFVFQLQTGLRPQELMALIWDDIDFEKGTVRIERACKWIQGVFRNFGRTKSKKSNRMIELAPEHLSFLQNHLERQRSAIKTRMAAGKPYGEEKVNEWVMKERPTRTQFYKSTNLVFPTISGKVPYMKHPRQQFKDMLKRAGISNDQSDFRWYDVRHSHASILLAKGEQPVEIAERMGHSLQMFLETYAHVLPNRRRGASILFVSLIPIE